MKVRVPAIPLPPQVPRASARVRIRRWWNERIVDGCQLQHIEDTHEPIDWMGEHRWKRLVAVHALHRDYCRCTEDHEMSFAKFAVEFRRATWHDDFVQRRPTSYHKPLMYARFTTKPRQPLPL